MLLSLIASHHELSLDLLERLSADAHVVGKAVAMERSALAGAVVLATCNRFEVYLELAPGADATRAAAAAVAVIASTTGQAAADVAANLRVLGAREVPAHLFAVATGLESMVVGEAEISGQVRRALSAARADGTTSSGLERLFQTASRTARDVGTRTGLGAAGRSVVSVALDLAEPDLPDWTQVRAVLVGTGSYAGASLAAMRRRGCHDIRVYSPSGRAPEFASRRGVRAIEPEGLAAALRTADLVVTCSGAVSGVLDAATVSASQVASGFPRVLVDLALRHDVEPAVAELDRVRLITLATVRELAPAERSEPAEQARRLVEAAADEFEAARSAREHDAWIVAERRRVLVPVEAEVARIRAAGPGADGAEQARDRSVRALRAEVRAQLHGPTMRARSAARVGDDAALAAALAELAAIPAPVVPERAQPQG